MVIVAYMLVVLFSTTQSAAAKLFNRCSTQSAVFNALKATSALFFLLLIAAFGFSFHLPTMVFGFIYGAALCLSMHAGYKALCMGPMALTCMLVSFSVLLPLIWGVTVWQEELNPFQYTAFVFLLMAIVLTNLGKPKETCRNRSSHRLWLPFVGITFLCNGVCSILQKQHQTLYPNAYSTEFMLFAMLFCSALFSALALRGCSLKDWKEIKGKRYGVLSGVANGLANLLTLVLAGLESASILFPVISAGTLLASLLFGRFVFKEKLRVNHYLALGFGMLAVIFLKL